MLTTGSHLKGARNNRGAWPACCLLSLLLWAFALGLGGCRMRSGARSAAPVRPTMPAIQYATSLPTYTPTPTQTATPAVRYLHPTTPIATPTPTLAEAAQMMEAATVTATSAATSSSYTVQPGDTLYGIAQRFGVSVADLVQANGIENPALIRVGQVLIIPGRPLTEEAVPTPSAPTEPSAPVTTTAPVSQQEPLQRPVVRPTAVLLRMSAFEQALYPLPPEHPGYPYQGLDFSRIGPPELRSFPGFVLENSFTEVVVIPDLGGRIYQVVDKVSGIPLLYNNPSVIPSSWGIRGWWLAIGGVEWCFPTEEHGLIDYLPWKAEPEQGESEAAIVLSTTEERTGVLVRTRVSLVEGDSTIHVRTELYNGTDTARRVQYWQNAMFAPGGRAVPSDCWVTLPAAQAQVHSTSDPGLASGQVIPWPLYGVRDLRDTSSWRGHLGLFAYPSAQAPFAGIQCSASPGLLQLFEPQTWQGVKFFGLGDTPFSRYSGEPSSYMEMWLGLTPTFDDYTTLAPGERRVLESRYVPLPAMPPLTTANENLALSVTPEAIAVASSRPLKVQVSASSSAGQELASWEAELIPGKAWEAPERPPDLAAIEIIDAASRQLLLSWAK
jgi:LysM repeat protein